MHRFTILAFVLCQFVNLRAGNFELHYGTGVIAVNIDSLSTLTFWSTPETKTYWNKLVITPGTINRGDLNTGFYGKADSVFRAEFQPQHFSTDIEKRGLMLWCIEVKGEWAKVVVNQVSHQTAWVVLSKHVTFLPVVDFYRRFASVEFGSGKAQVYQKPSSKSGMTDLSRWLNEGSNREFIIPLQVKGEWMEAEVIIRDEDSNEKYRCTGWIRWRNADHPILSYNIMGC